MGAWVWVCGCVGVHAGCQMELSTQLKPAPGLPFAAPTYNNISRTDKSGDTLHALNAHPPSISLSGPRGKHTKTDTNTDLHTKQCLFPGNLWVLSVYSALPSRTNSTRKNK